jgi:hypothetical protein
MKRYLVVRILIRVIPLAALFVVSAQARSDSIMHSDQLIHIQYAATLEKAKHQQTYLWLQQVAEALLTVYGEWPKDKFNITVQSSSSRHSPVPWGQVTRGEPDTVLLVVNSESDFKEITSDWTAFHELSHLLIPYSGHGDMWFSEGLATYYQNIIQARIGLLSETGLWDKLASGFERGRKQNQLSHLNLTEISDNMRKYRNFMRVHWSGVHYWLTADIKLRQQSQNKTTLDSLLKQLKACCQHSSMSAAAIAEQLDLIADVDLFKPLFDEYRDSLAMPDYEPVLAALGVISGQTNREYGVVLIADAPNAHIRTSIYQGDG